MPRANPTNTTVRTPDNPAESQAEAVPFDATQSFSADRLVAAASIPQAQTEAEIIHRINQAVRARWSENQVNVPAFVTDEEWRQRVFRALLGRELTADET